MCDGGKAGGNIWNKRGGKSLKRRENWGKGKITMSHIMLFWKKTIKRWETVQEQEERCMGIHRRFEFSVSLCCFHFYMETP